MKTILVVANETLGGAPLLARIKEKAAADAGTRVVVCVPRTNPRQGNIIYDEAVFDAAQVRIDLARKILREEGIEAIGEVGDPDPYTATMDAIAEYHPDEIVISTYPAASSGWLRRDLIERIAEATRHARRARRRRPRPGGPALRRHPRGRQPHRRLRRPCSRRSRPARTSCERHVFIFVVPQEGGHGVAARQARARLTQMIDRARAADLICAGMIGDPDPYTAVMNALQFFRVDDIVISTLPATRSGWMRADLIERVRARLQQARRARRVRPRPRRPRRSVMEAASIAHAEHDHEHHGPPPANRSSRVETQLLGMLLFIVSEVMVFGAFFTAYFFIRVVAGDQWFPFQGHELPVAVAGVNTAILLSSSVTMHWAETSIKNGNRLGLKAGILSTFLLGLHVPLRPDQRVRPHRLRPARLRPGLGLLRPDRPARRARLRRPHPAGDGRGALLPRALLARGAPRRRGAGHLLALRRRHVGGRVLDRLRALSVLNPLRSEEEAFRALIYVVAVVVVIVVLVLVGRAIF